MAKISVVLCLIFALSVPARAHAEGTRVALHLGFQAQAVDQSVESDTLLYPNFSLSLEHPKFDIQIESIMLLVMVDGVASVIKYLAGGNDNIILYDALNDRDPARISFFDFRGRYNFWQTNRLTLGVGPGIEYLSHTFYAPGRSTFTSLNVDVNAAMRVVWDDTDLLWIVKVGNGWTEYADFDPIIGTVLRVRQRVHGPLWVFGRTNFAMQHFDNSDWTEPFVNSGVDPQQAKFVEWIHIYGIEAGIALVFD